MDSSQNIFINKILVAAAKRRASTVHLTVGAYPSFRIDDELVELKDETVITNDFVAKLAEGWLDEDQKKELIANKEIILVKEIAKKFRIKINFFYQKKFLSSSWFLIPSQIPPLANLGLPKSVHNLIAKKSGLIIIAGPFGSGRTTTMASMVEEINNNRKENIITIEKPIEYLFINKKSLIEQRQVGRDVNSFTAALKSAQQSDVDAIAVGATMEKGVIPAVVDFANSGRLAFMVMNTSSVIQSIEEILSVFPTPEKQQAQLKLSESLQAVVSQRLVPRTGGGQVLAAEVLIVTEAVRSLIRDGRVKQIFTILQSSRGEGMIELDQSLSQLVKSGTVLADQAVIFAKDQETFRAKTKT